MDGDASQAVIFSEQLKAWRHERSAVAVGEESEVADGHEAGSQQMEPGAAQELLDWQSHEPLLVAVGGISPAEGEVAIRESDQPGVGDDQHDCLIESDIGRSERLADAVGF